MEDKLMEDIMYAPATPDDLAPVRALLGECGLPSADLDAAALVDFLVGRRDGRLVATVAIQPLGGDVGLFRSLAVAPALRGLRIAHELWARARAAAGSRGIRALYLLTTTAEPLFARWGFRRVIREAVPAAVRATPEYGTLCPSTAAVMAMDLRG